MGIELDSGGIGKVRSLQELVWLTQLGLSVATPLLICVLGSVWLRNHFEMGAWIIFLGLFLGLSAAFSSGLTFFNHTKMLERKDKKKGPPPVSFNDHD